MVATWTEGEGGAEIHVIDFDRDQPPAGAAPAHRPAGAGAASWRGGWRLAGRLFAYLPAMLAAVYFFALAADRYETETQLVIRNAGPVELPREATGGIALGLAGRSDNAAMVARNFILSRDAMAALQAQLPLRAMLAAPAPDLGFRFPPLLLPDGEEALYRHYLRFVDAEVDGSSGILLLRVRAFTAGDAQRMAQALVAATEALVNRLHRRPADATVAAALAEVERFRTSALAAQDALTLWRTEQRIVDPARLAQAYAETIARLALELAQVNAQLAELRAASPRNPQLVPLAAREAALRGQIRQEREAMAGAAAGLAGRLGDYERLALDREFAERSFQSALSAAELARRDAEQQKLFLEQIARPQAPDWPRHPRRVLLCLGVLAGNVMLVAVARQLLRDLQTHARD